MCTLTPSLFKTQYVLDLLRLLRGRRDRGKEVFLLLELKRAPPFLSPSLL